MVVVYLNGEIVGLEHISYETFKLCTLAFGK